MTPTQLLLKREYGTTIFDLARRLTTLDDRAERTRQAQLVVNLMAKMDPEARLALDPHPKLWHHMMMMCAGELDVDCPYDLPPVGPDDLSQQRPKRLEYRLRLPKVRHYGRHLESLIQQASRLEDPQEREAAIITVGRLMKSFYRTYNKEGVSDALIYRQMQELAADKLRDIPLHRVEAEKLFDSQLIAGNGPGMPTNDALARTGGGKKKFNKKRKR